MARVTGNLSNRNTVVKKLRQINFDLPVPLAENQEVEIALYPNGETVEWEIRTIMADHRKKIATQGQFSFGAETDFVPTEVLSLKEIKRRCGQRETESQFYQLIETNGLKYGSGLRAVQEIFFNQDEALARLKLPENLKGGVNQYILHPAFMEGMIQSITRLMVMSDEAPKVYLPFSVEEIEIYRNLTEKSYFYIFRSRETGYTERRFNGILVGEDGRPIIKIQNLVVNELKKPIINQPDPRMDVDVKQLLQQLERGELEIDMVNDMLTEKLLG